MKYSLLALFVSFLLSITACVNNHVKSKGGDSIMTYKSNSVSPLDTLDPTVDSSMTIPEDTIKN